MSVKWDVVDSLAGLSEDLKVEGNFVARIHDEVKKIRDERDALRADNADLLARLDAAAFAVQQGLRDIADRQRKLCQTYLRDRAQEVLYDKGSERLADGLLAAAQMIEYAPLVTEKP